MEQNIEEYPVENPEDGFKDPRNEFPKEEYFNKQSTNFAARNVSENNLYIGGGDVALDLGLQPHADTQYPLNQVRETVSGHITEIDDTPGAERILFKHRTGAGVEMRADGTVIVSSTNNTIQVTGNDQKVIVEGDGELVYHGNLKLTVNGNFDLNVGGDFNVTTGGDNIETVKGGYKQNVVNDHETVVRKNKSEFIGRSSTETILEDKNLLVKGKTEHFNQGDYNIFVGYKDPDDGTGSLVGALRVTAADEIFMTSDNINIVGTDITVAGDHGDIGGDNVIMHNYNMFTGHSIDVGDTITVPTIYNDTQVTTGHMNIPVVYGDLQGTATQAMVSNQAGLHPSSGAHAGAGYGYTATTDTTADVAVDTTTRTRVDSDEVTEYLHKSDKGIRSIRIDYGDDLLDTIDKSREYNNISVRVLTTPEIRSKLRDPNSLRNTDFTSSQIIEQKLSADWSNPSPPYGYGRIINSEITPTRGSTALPNSNIGTKRVK